MKLKNLHVDYVLGIVWSATWPHVSHLALLSSVCWLHPQIIAKHFTTCFLIHIQEEREGFFFSKLQKTNNLFFNWNDLGNILVSEETSVARRTLFTDPNLNQIRTNPWNLEGHCINMGKVEAIADEFQILSGLIKWTHISQSCHRLMQTLLILTSGSPLRVYSGDLVS